jgi:dihydroorotate dehydrogenase electron transfer subunit
LSKFFTAEIVCNTFTHQKACDFSETTRLNSQFKLLTLQPVPEIIAPEPGQFYMIQTGTASDPLLKRPFSIYSMQHNRLGFIYRIRGKGTTSLSQLREGDMLQVIGPLGNSYPEPDGDFIAVAGGVGIASLLPFMRKYEKHAYLFYGAMNSDELVMLEEARQLSKEIFITTDNGSDGQSGRVTNAVRDFIGESLVTPPEAGALPVYSCGPTAMLKALSQITRAAGLICYASLEEHMACGIGACLGCMVKTVAGQKRICKEGPIFNLEDIVW